MTRMDERGMVSFMGLCALGTLLIFGMTLLYTVRSSVEKAGMFQNEKMLQQIAENRLEQLSVQMEKDVEFCRALEDGEAKQLDSPEVQGVQTASYVRKAGERIFLLVRAEKQHKKSGRVLYMRVRGYLTKKTTEDGDRYVWSGRLP